MTNFKYEHYKTIEEMLEIIRNCEGSHIQQVVFSTYHKALTQVDFTDKIIRSNLKIPFWEDKTIKKPIVVRFRRSDGTIAKLNATKLVKKPAKVKLKRRKK